VADRNAFWLRSWHLSIVDRRAVVSWGRRGGLQRSKKPAGTADEKNEAGLRRFGLPVSRLDRGGRILGGSRIERSS
jgi:hypothetical protein